MNALDWAWLAGIIDGEGCITIITPTARHMTRFSPALIVANSSLDMIEKVRRIAKREDLSIRKVKSVHYYYEIRFQKQADIKAILENCLPHLTAKKRSAEIMLEILRLREKHRPSSWGPKEIDLTQKLRTLGKGPQRLHKLPKRAYRSNYIQRSYWTKEDIQFLIKNKDKMSSRELSQKLGRSYMSVDHKIRRL